MRSRKCPSCNEQMILDAFGHYFKCFDCKETIAAKSPKNPKSPNNKLGWIRKIFKRERLARIVIQCEPTNIEPGKIREIKHALSDRFHLRLREPIDIELVDDGVCQIISTIVSITVALDDGDNNQEMLKAAKGILTRHGLRC